MRTEGGEPSAWSHGARPVVLTIGSFDGVHAGHQALLGNVVHRARARGANSAVLTFDPHPRCVVDPAHCPPSITTVEERTSLFAGEGIDRTFIFPFNTETRQWSAEKFCDGIAAAVDLTSVVVGEDFHFGRGREGNVDFLREWGWHRGIEVVVVEPILEGGAEVSSTRIREVVAAGDLVAASRLLGRPFFIDARVVGGEKVGAKLGFPTANLQVAKNKLIPQDGVYAGWLYTGGAWHQAAISVGTRPTFAGTATVVEAFALHFDGDLYGKSVRCAFARKTRDQVKFDSADDLAVRMRDDVAEISALLAEMNPPVALEAG